MKIVPIFETKLYAFQYKDEEENEYDRLMKLWTNIDFLFDFAKENNVPHVNEFVNDILEDAFDIQDFLDHPGTNLELKKLFAAKKYLQENGVFNDDSFFELIKEQS